MKGDKFTPLEYDSREILCKYDIDPFCGCANLAITQNRCHSEAYAQRVFNDLKAVDEGENPTPGKIEEVLVKLAEWHSTCGDPGSVDKVLDE